jgi:choline dehydrogenase
MQARDAYDYLIVGAGSSGCILASRLTESASTRVWRGEAGGAGRDWLLNVPGFLFRTSTAPRFNWSFLTEPEPELHGRRLFWSQGRVLGGSSTINGMLYVRGHPREYDLWGQLGCEGWAWDEVLPHFRASERNERGVSAAHGDRGPIAVTRGAPDEPICTLFLEAAARAGHALLDDFNGPSMDGFGHYDRTIGAGRRNSVASTFLRPVMARPNLTVMTDATVTRLLLEGGRARGIELRDDGTKRQLWADREVILCAGAINSAKLLMLSGIGPADHLHRYGIPVVLDQPGVGGNLQNHLCYRLEFACSAPVTAYRYMRPWPAVRACLDYALHRRGVLAQTPVATGGFFRTEPGLDMPDAQVQLQIGLIGPPGASAWQRLPRREGFSIAVNAGKDGKRQVVGSIPNYGGALVDPGYLEFVHEGKIQLGEMDGSDTPRLRTLTSMLEALTPVQVSQNIWGQIWAKEVYANQIVFSALADARIHETLGVERWARVAGAVVGEAVDIAVANGIELEAFDFFDPVLYKPKTPEDTGKLIAKINNAIWLLRRDQDPKKHTFKKQGSGMWWDIVYRKRKSETGAMKSKLIAYGKAKGADTRLTEKLCRMIVEIEEGKRQLGFHNYQELEAYVAAIGKTLP